MSPRQSAPTFPPYDEQARAVERPSHADSSHVARRRASSAPAHEVSLDEIELFDETEAPAAPVVPAAPAAPVAPSIAPTATTTPPPPIPAPSPLPFRASRPIFQVPLKLGAAVRRRSPLTVVLIGAFLAAAGGTTAGFLALPHASAPEAPSTPVSAPPSPAAAAAPPPVAPSAPPPALAASISPPPAASVPVVEVSKLPRAHASDGTVVGAAGHRLWIDGVLAASWQASVTCGSHVVQVGSAGTPRAVDVPCGESVAVSP